MRRLALIWFEGDFHHLIEINRCAVNVLRAYQTVLAVIGCVALPYGFDSRFNATGAPWIIFAIALGFLAVIQALVVTTAISVDAAAARASATATDRKAIAEKLAVKGVAH